MMRAHTARGLSLAALVLLGLACRKSEPAEPTVDARANNHAHVEFHVSAPTMSAQQVEATVLHPLEAGLLAVPKLRHLTTEARAGHGRLSLELDLQGAELGAIRLELVERSRELQGSLPSAVAPPALLANSSPTTVRWFISSETLDPLTMSRLHGRLAARSEAIAGVQRVDTCAPRRRVIVELEPERLLARGLDSSTVARAVEDGLAKLPGFDDTSRGVSALRALPIDASAPDSPLLGELAAIRYGFGEPTCLAASAGGLVASAAVSVASPDALTALNSMLDDATRELPPEVLLRRFGPEDTVLALSLAPELTLEEAAEQIGGGFPADRGNWLVEVGVDAQPCASTGLRLHLSVPGSSKANAGLTASLREVPGVLDVEDLGAPPRRQLWIVGPEHERLFELALTLAAEHPTLHAHIDASHPELRVEHDAERLAHFGLSEAEVARQVEFARGAEVGVLFEDDGTPLPLVLRVAGADDPTDPERLSELQIRTADTTIPLRDLAGLEWVLVPGRLCRRDSQRAVMLTLPADSADADAIVSAIESALPPGFSLAKPE